MGFVLFVQTSREPLQYKSPDATQICSHRLSPLHALSTKDDGTQFSQISHAWPIASKNTLSPLMYSDRREEKSQLPIYCLELAIDKTFYLNIFRHLMRIQYQMDCKGNRNDRKIVKTFGRDLRNENVFSRSFQHSSSWPKKGRHFASKDYFGRETRKCY